MTNKLELFVLTTLFLTPAFVILSHVAAAPSLFAAHPAANAVAHLILSPLAIYLIIQRKSVADAPTRLTLVKAHFALQLLAFLAMGAGGAAVYLNKDKLGKAHFASTHSWVAGTFGTLWSLNLLGGVSSTFLGAKADWTWKNPGHRVGGVVGFLGCGVTSLYGLYSGQWAATTLGADKQFKVALLVGLAYGALLVKAVVSLGAKPKPAAKKTA